MDELLLLASNARRKYSEDILSVLAMPEGSIVRFRYDQKYVSADVQRAAKDVVDTDGLVGFVADTGSDHPFLLPIRYVSVVSVECPGRVFVFNLRIGGYPALDDGKVAPDELTKKSYEQLKQLWPNRAEEFKPVQSSPPSLGARPSSEAARNWEVIAERLAWHDTFKSSYFLRVDPLTTLKNDDELTFDDEGRLKLVDGQSLRVRTVFYSDDYAPTAKQSLSCSTDDKFVRVSSDAVYDVALRYDLVEFWLHPSTLNYGTVSTVKIKLENSDEASTSVAAYVGLPVIVRRSRPKLAIRAAVTSLGALLVALPAILGTGSSLGLRLVSALFGASILAFTTVFLGAPKS
jgi:hypothetical protein